MGFQEHKGGRARLSEVATGEAKGERPRKGEEARSTGYGRHRRWLESDQRDCGVGEKIRLSARQKPHLL